MMLYPRIIPCLLIHNKGLVKTIQFKNPKYVGDPINAVKIFNEKEVDELMVVDIDATVENREPDYNMIKNLANECRMPLCYSGGIKTINQAKKILTLGVEKIAMSSIVLNNPNIVKEFSKEIGVQSVVVVLDIKKKIFGGYDIVINNGEKKTGINPIDFIKKIQKIGVGEVILNSVDNDGMMKGYDFNIIDKIKMISETPITVLGGAGSLEDIGKLISKYSIIGASAGSIFVFKGKYKAVLINYPNQDEKRTLITNNFMET